MKAILIHGMGRTPLSQLLLAERLRRRGIEVHLHGYLVRQPFDACVDKLVRRTARLTGDMPFIMIGHSLGAVLIRAALPHLGRPPRACYFLAPPSTACKAARHFATNPLFQLITGEIGQRLADTSFMEQLPVPPMPFHVYAGDSGYRGRFSPFGESPNDGVLAVSETAISPHEPIVVPSLHTFIMNSRFVADHIVQTSAAAQ